MAAVTAGVRPSVADLVPCASHFASGYIAGETIAAGDFVYKKAADGLIWRGSGAAANEAAGVWGVSLDDAVAGDPVTIAFRLALGYKPLNAGTPITSGLLYLGVNGKLDTVAQTGDAVGVARVLSADGEIYIRCSP